MKHEQAQIRNHKILRLRGILPQLASLIPDDAKQYISEAELEQFGATAKKILTILNLIKVKNYACKSCRGSNTWKQTRAKRATNCDICGDWQDEHYYIIPKECR